MLFTHNFKNIRRIIATARVMARYDCLFLLDIIGTPKIIARPAKMLASKKYHHLRRGQRLALAFQALGTSFIKLGQQLSTRSDLLEEDICEDLRVLQDKLPAFEGDIVKQTIEEQLGKPIEEIYSEFDFTPVAAASVAQVHFAITIEGKKVAVKVLRPNVEKNLKESFEFFAWLAALVERRKPEYRNYKLPEAVKLFRRTTQMEINFLNEGASCMQFAENFKDDPTFNVPEVDWRRTSEKVLTMARVEGIPLSDVEAIHAAGIDTDIVMKNASMALFKQAFEHGFFHADLHPGNIFVHIDGSITAVDFGIVGYLDTHFRRTIAQYLVAILNHNWIEAAKAHLKLGVLQDEHSIEELARAMAGVAWPIMDRPQNEISAGKLISRVTKTARIFNMQAQPKLLLLEKALIAAEGSGRFLNPEVNIWYHARASVKDWMKENLGPKGQIKAALENIQAETKRIPRVLDKFEYYLDTREMNEKATPKKRVSSWRGFFMGIIVGAVIVCGFALLHHKDYLWL